MAEENVILNIPLFMSREKLRRVGGTLFLIKFVTGKKATVLSWFTERSSTAPFVRLRKVLL